MKPKLLLVLLILLVALFAAATVMGATRPTGKASDGGPGWVDALGGLLASKQVLKAEDIGTAIPPECAQGLRQGVFVVRQGFTCSLFVNTSSARVRTLPLRLVTGISALVVFAPFGENRMTAKQKLEGDRKKAEVQVWEEGGELKIACPSAGGAPECRLEVAK